MTSCARSCRSTVIVSVCLALASSCSTAGVESADSAPVRSASGVETTSASADSPSDSPSPTASGSQTAPTTDAITAFEAELAGRSTLERVTDPAAVNESWSAVLLRGIGDEVDEDVIAAIEEAEAATLNDARLELEAQAPGSTPASSTPVQGFRKRQDLSGGLGVLAILVDGFGGLLASGPAGQSSVTGQPTAQDGATGAVSIGGGSDGRGRTTVNLSMEYEHKADDGQTSSVAMAVEFTGPACPPDDGILKIEFKGTARATSAGGGHTSQEFTGTVAGTFDDEGEVTTIDIEIDIEASRSGGSSGQSYVDFTYSLTGLDGAATVTSSTSVEVAINRSSSQFDTGNSDDLQMFTDSMRSAQTLGIGVFALRQHRAQNNGCVIVEAKAPTTASVKQAVPIDVHTRHVVERVELDKRVVATLSGPGSVDPEQLPKTAGTITYTAGEKPGDAGTITFESRSRRGIGRTTLTITVRPSFRIDQPVGDLRFTGVVCGLDSQFTLDSAPPAPGSITFVPWGTAGGAYAGSGQVGETQGEMEWSGTYTVDATDPEHPTIRMDEGTTKMINVPIIGEAPLPGFWQGGVTFELIADPAACP